MQILHISIFSIQILKLFQSNSSLFRIFHFFKILHISIQILHFSRCLPFKFFHVSRQIDRYVFHKVFDDKNQNWQGPQLDRFLISLCTKKYIFRRRIGMYKGFQSKDHMGRNNQHEMREYSEYIFGKFACGIEILASPGIPGIELEKRYLEYLRIQLTSKNLYLEYRWII